MPSEEIDQKYLAQASALEAEFFDIVDEGLPSQHRVLKSGKTIEEFNLHHGDIWNNHEAELIAEGFMEPPTPPEPARDLIQEQIDDLRTRVVQLEKKTML